MHILHTIIGLPKVSEHRIAQDDTSTESVFDIAPLPRGYGMTLGHALRRSIISSIPGTRVTGIKIEWVSHEYTTLPGLHESVLDIMLNLKSLVLEKSDTGVTWISLKKNKAGKVTAADIKTSGGVEILNKDLYITEIDRDGFELDMQIRVEKNVGYKSIDTLKKEDDDVMILVVDASFSPVINVSTEVRSERYGDMTDLDHLSLTSRPMVLSLQKVLSNLVLRCFVHTLTSSVIQKSWSKTNLWAMSDLSVKKKRRMLRQLNTVRISHTLISSDSLLVHSTLSSMEISSLSNSSRNAQKQNSVLSKASGKKLWTKSVQLSEHRSKKLLGDD
jgi:hypothetical protein